MQCPSHSINLIAYIHSPINLQYYFQTHVAELEIYHKQYYC